jgi:hypothetical protein
MAEMQQIIYDDAPYQILVNRANMQAYRTDKFAGWQLMPSGTGTPLFVMGNINYTLLTDATAVPSPAPTPTPAPVTEAPTGAATPAPATAAPPTAAPPTAAPSPEPGGGGTGGDNSLLLVGGVVVLVVILAAGLVIVRRGRAGGPGDAEE